MQEKLLYLPLLRPALEAEINLGVCAGWGRCHFSDKWGKFVLPFPPHGGGLVTLTLGYGKVTRAQLPLLFFCFKGEGKAVFTFSSS